MQRELQAESLRDLQGHSMPIVVSSSYTTDSHSQVGGGRWTVERHLDAVGNEVAMIGPYLWDGIADRDAILSAHASQINEAYAQAEIDALLGN